MSSILKKKHGRNYLGTIQNKPENDDGLLDDGDDFQDSSLSLQIGSPQEDILVSPFDDLDRAIVPIEGEPTPGVGLVNFEVVSADIIKEGRSSYVKYTILINGPHKVQHIPGMVEKRYSDFEHLNSQLHKNFPEFMQEVAFPGKVIMGNFKNETIARRSRAFEQYLSHLFSIDVIRFSKPFRDFLYLSDVNEAKQLLSKGDHSNAAALLEKCVPVLEKLMGFWHEDAVVSLCCLVICYQAMNKTEVAITYADTALTHLQDDYKNVYYLPLLHQNIYLHWMIGKSKNHLEEKLSAIQKQGIKTEGDFNLKTIILDHVK